MLEALLRYLNNWFVRDTHIQYFTIAGGSITLPFLQNGQFFRIRGSIFNDGLYQYPANDLKDEVFCGAIDALAVPKAIQELADEMKTWNERYGGATESPYSSESFGGYSYTKATTENGGEPTVWSTFQSRLSQWRKMKGG